MRHLENPNCVYKESERRFKFFYENSYKEIVDGKPFESLLKEEKQQAVAQFALTEFVNARSVVDTLFKGNNGDSTFEGLKLDLGKNKYFHELLMAQGQISKTSQNKNVISLMNYALMTNHHSAPKSDGVDKFNKNAAEILKCINYFKAAEPRLKKAIQQESTELNSPQIATRFFQASVFLVQMTADLLYSNSLQGNFNYNAKPPIADSVYFSYDNGVVDEMMVFIEYLNSGFASGKIYKTLDPSLQEALNESVHNIETLNEGVFDTIFGLITHFKSLDLVLLFPIYFARAVIYWAAYLFTSMKNLTLNIDESIEMQKAKYITKPQYEKYSTNANVKGEKAKQAMNKASFALDLSAKQDTKALQGLQQGTSSVLI